jgi:hypothetical protein
MKEGFIVGDGTYAAVPYGKKQLMIIHNGQQLEVVNTILQAQNYIKQHKKSNSQSGTVISH